MVDVVAYCDGSCAPKEDGKPGGYGLVLLPSRCDSKALFLSGSTWDTTNNRMELYAVIRSLELIRPSQSIQFILDSQYVTSAFNLGWLESWQRKSFRGTKNADLWERVPELVRSRRLEWKWVPGHSNILFNEVADTLAGFGTNRARVGVQDELIAHKPEAGWKAAVQELKVRSERG